jgi:1,2-phenylacetyl-CoA epoxidase catalytic subunit
MMLQQSFDECTEPILAKVMFKITSENASMLNVFRDVVKKLANIPKEATVREADLMSVPQCRVGYNSM